MKFRKNKLGLTMADLTDILEEQVKQGLVFVERKEDPKENLYGRTGFGQWIFDNDLYLRFDASSEADRESLRQRYYRERKDELQEKNNTK